jgi:hypothetical protein
MLNVDLLLIGDARDGPTEEIVEIRNLEHALRLFGGYAYEKTTLYSTTSGHTLTETPWGSEVTPLQADSDGELIPLDLFEFAASGATLTFTPPGLTWYSGGNPSEVIFRYRTNPGNTALLKGIYAALTTGARVHALRLGDPVHASTTYVDWTFSARYAGTRYNGTTITVTGSNVVIDPAPGTGRRTVYTPTSDTDLYDQLLADFERNRHPLLIEGPFSNTALTIPSGTYVLAGGTNGTLTAQQVYDYLDEQDLAGADVICPVGLTTTNLSAVSLPTLLEETVYPHLLVVQASTTGPSLSGSANEERYVVSVGFNLEYESGTPRAETDEAAPVVAALLAQSLFGGTLAALPQQTYTPKYTQGQLHAVTAAGHLVAYTSISKGSALWYAVTGDSEWPVSTFRAYQEVVRAVYTLLEPTLGNTILSTRDLEAMLGLALSDLRGGEVLEWGLSFQHEEIFVDLLFRPHGEIRTVTFRVALGSPENV